MADYLGIRPASSTVRFSFTTHAASGAAVAPSSAFETADLRIYKDGSATQRSSAAGVTMTSPFDSVTGLHHVDIDLSDNTDAGFYAAGSFYEVHLVPDETVDSLAVAKVLVYFDIGVAVANVTQLGGDAQSLTDLKDFADAGYDPATNKVEGVKLADTLTTYTGNTPQTGDNYARIGAPAGASVSADVAAVKGQTAAIEVDTQDLQSRTPAALVGGRTDSSVGAMASGVVTASAIAADAITDAKVAADVTIASVAGAVGSVTGAVGSVTGNVGGNVVGSVASVTAGVTLAASAIQAIWDALTSALTTIGSIGKLLVDNINATISSRATPAQVNTEADTALADVGVTTTVTGRIDVAISSRLATASYAAPLDAAGTRTAVGLASANLDTQLDALPTNAELATALAAADDAILAVIGALNNLSSAQVSTAISSAALATAASLATAQAAITAIKTKTDSLTFTVAGLADANMQRINDVALVGDGAATPWGPV